MRTNRNVFLVFFFVVVAGGMAVEGGQREEVTLWPAGLPKGFHKLDAGKVQELAAKSTSERLTYVETPSLTLFPAPKDKATGCAVIVCPGGGYNILAWEKEGVEVAQWFNRIGVFAAVLKYRVPRRDPDYRHKEPLQDAQRAVRVVRKNAPQWGIDSSRVGMLGFSVGGNLTIMTGTQWHESTYERVDDADDLSSRPDFLCPIYAAYLGDAYRDDVAELGSLVRITAQTPPTFMAVTWDDKMRGAQAAQLFIALKKAGVPAELHIYSKGGHGYGLRPSENPVSAWPHLCEEWMRVSGLLAKTR